MNTVMGCRPVSSRLISIRLRAAPFNITVVQVYAPMSEYDYNEIEEFYDQLQNVIDQTPKKDILVVQGDWNAKVGKIVIKVELCLVTRSYDFSDLDHILRSKQSKTVAKIQSCIFRYIFADPEQMAISTFSPVSFTCPNVTPAQA